MKNNTKIFTRIKNPWAAVEEICLELEKTWRLPYDADMICKILYLQLLTIHARVLLLQENAEEALSCCEKALEIASTCWLNEGSIEMGVYWTISLTKFIISELEDSLAIEGKANDLYINDPYAEKCLVGSGLLKLFTGSRHPSMISYTSKNKKKASIDVYLLKLSSLYFAKISCIDSFPSASSSADFESLLSPTRV